MYDCLRKQIHFVPNEVYEKINSNDYIIDKNVENEDLIDFLYQKNLIFKTNTSLLKNFPDINNDIDISYKIITCVIVLSDITSRNLYKLNNEGINGAILQFNIILTTECSKASLALFVTFMEENEADTFELTLCEGFMNSEYLFDLLKPINKILVINNFANLEIKDGTVKTNRFVNPIDMVNLHLALDFLTYYESENYHVYFNRKLFIGKNTEIKNVYESSDVHGYLKDIENPDIDSIISQVGFKKFWEVKKEDTLVCNVCEFKRFCVDNNTPVPINNKWKYEKECDYNPYISKWKNEEGYLALQDCGIKIYEDQVFIGHERLQKINEVLWE